MSDSEEEEILDISDGEVLAKYRLAAEIANRTMVQISARCEAGAKLVDLCAMGDAMITEECGKVHNKGRAKVEDSDKGVAFPTCVSVNHVVGHFCPPSDDETVLAEGDLVKLDLGVHIDGFIAVVANSLVVCSNPEEPVADRRSDVIHAVAVAAEATLATIKPGCTNSEITAIFNRAAEAFDCRVVEGVLSHVMKRHVIDGNKVILSKETPEMKVEEEEIEELDVLAIDILMSTGEGEPKEIDEQKTTIYKHQVDQTYSLKMKASREVFSQITSDHPTLPFALRQYDGSRARLGMKECINHDLFSTYPVLEEKEGDFVAHAKFTVLVGEEGVQRVTGGFLPQNNVTPVTQCADEELMGFYTAAVAKAEAKAAKKKKKKK
jgi:curved DNA binding protein